MIILSNVKKFRICIPPYLHTRTQDVYVSLDKCMFVCKHAFLCVYMYVGVCVCVCVCIGVKLDIFNQIFVVYHNIYCFFFFDFLFLRTSPFLQAT